MEQLQLDVRTDERVAVLTLADPERRNALNAAMVAEITEVFDRLEADDGVGAVVITGAPPAFCAGANLGNLAESTRESLTDIYEGFLRVGRSSLPTVAAVNGAAVGAGMNMALGCDVRLAGESARFDTRFMQIGLHPGGGHTWLMRRIVGPQTTMAAVVFGEVLNGREAERVGLAYRCVPDADLAAAAAELAGRAASAPTELVRVTKATIATMADIGTHEAAVDVELDPQVWSTRQPWFAERMAALRAKISRARVETTGE